MNYEFNPSELFKQNKPPIPIQVIAPMITISLILFTVIFSSITEIEILATTNGKVIPKGDIKFVNSPVSGVVSEVMIKNGSHVKNGDVLFKLEMERENKQLIGILDQIEIKEDLMNNITPYLDINEDNLLDKFILSKKTAASGDLQRKVVHNRLMLLYDNIEDLSERIDVTNSQIRKSQIFISKLQESLSYSNDIYNINQKLNKNGYISEIETKRLNIERQEFSFDIAAENEEIRKMSAEIENIRNNKKRTINKYKFELANLYQDLKLELLSLKASKYDLENRIKYEYITSNSSGYVEDLAIVTNGRYISSGELLLKVVPIQDEKIMEIIIPNKDVGFVQKGNEVRIKLDAYTYTRYGTIEGEITYLFQDSNKVDDQYSYRAYINLRDQEFKIGGTTHEISNGMTAQVDIITGYRTIISYFTDPIIDGIDQALKER